MFSILYLFQTGVISGLLVSVLAIFLGMTKFTTLNLTQYFGALLTGQSSGKVNFIAGFVFHILVSGCLANIYGLILDHFALAVTLRHAMYFGIVHTLISGIALHLTDKINLCVVQQTLPAMGVFAYKQGVTAFISFVLVHMLFAFFVFFILAR